MMDGQAQGGKDLRGLKALVAFMGVLIVLGTALVIGVIIHRIYAGTAAASNIPAPAPPAALPPAALRNGEHVAGIAAAGADLAVWVTGPGGDRVLLINPVTGSTAEALAGQK